MSDPSAAPEESPPRVPARAVVLSAAALWMCYYVLITVRSFVVDLDHHFDLLWRRGLVTLAGILVTLAAWQLLRRFDARPLAQRIIAALVVMLPAAVLLAAVNHKAFEAVEHKMIEQADQVGGGVKIARDVSGNVLIDLPEAPAPPPPPPPGVDPKDWPFSAGATKNSVIIAKKLEKEGLWRQLTDIAIGRYFLLLAWAALYLALGNAERVRAAERREGEYRRAAKNAELRSLRYQVNPHFLFNTLNSLSALVMAGRGEQAERMIQTISTFYRRSLGPDPTHDVPLSDEVDLQRDYLEIEAVRFPERLRSRIEVPDVLGEACVPGMILQPLVENSVKYAVSASSQPVTIEIVARDRGGKLELTVADNGPGAQTNGVSGTGIGLANVRDRLAARFGDEASVESGPRVGGGWSTTLLIPIVRRGC